MFRCMNRLRRISRTLLTPSMLVALLALSIALGGVAWAAGTIGSFQIINNSIQSADIRNGHVTSLDIKDFTIGARDIGSNAINSPRIVDGSITADDLAPGTVPRIEETMFLEQSGDGYVDLASVGPLLVRVQCSGSVLETSAGYSFSAGGSTMRLVGISHTPTSPPPGGAEQVVEFTTTSYATGVVSPADYREFEGMVRVGTEIVDFELRAYPVLGEGCTFHLTARVV